MTLVELFIEDQDFLVFDTTVDEGYIFRVPASISFIISISPNILIVPGSTGISPNIIIVPGRTGISHNIVKTQTQPTAQFNRV